MNLNIQKVEIAMGEAGFTYSALAKVCSVSRTTLSYIRNGKSCKPDVAGKIARGLNVPLSQIIQEQEAR